MQIGDELEIRINHTAGKYGTTRFKNKLVLVPNAKENDEFLIKITKVLNTIAYGKIIRRIRIKDFEEEEYG